MGQRGTEVANEAADIVLADDNFVTVLSAVEGGRTIYANITKFVHMMFSHNVGEVLMVVLLQVLATYFPPLTTVLGTVTPTAIDWLVVASCGVLAVAIVEGDEVREPATTRNAFGLDV